MIRKSKLQLAKENAKNTISAELNVFYNLARFGVFRERTFWRIIDEKSAIQTYNSSKIEILPTNCPNKCLRFFVNLIRICHIPLYISAKYPTTIVQMEQGLSRMCQNIFKILESNNKYILYNDYMRHFQVKGFLF